MNPQNGPNGRLTGAFRIHKPDTFPMDRTGKSPIPAGDVASISTPSGQQPDVHVYKPATRTPRLSPKVFVRAAELVDAGLETFSCVALKSAVLRADDYHGRLSEMLCAGEEHLSLYVRMLETMVYSDEARRWCTCKFCDDREHRVFALLLAAELARDGFTAEDFT